ncbi:ABC transporter permease [Atlantibacter hermannii]|uniref:ABC transporter permease n=1 Tax=Atlantibacter hermannii TaxID=565 RepID=UPI00289956D4|nr:ABC transporter permease [Atlantibacter hermannii]
MLSHPATPKEFLKSFWINKTLIITLIKRDVVGRYQNSLFGLLWSFFNPIFMLAVYTFIFSEVFKARWLGGTNSKAEFALILFAGLIVFNIFAECFNRAPGIVLQNANYVKKVIFPLEILAWVNVGAALFHATICVFVWVIFYFFAIGTPHITILLFPIVLFPLVMLVMGLSWLFAALGAYLRDIAQLAVILTTVMMFMSPIFYPIEALPLSYQKYLVLNPLSLAISEMREVLYWGTVPSLTEYCLYLAMCVSCALLGFAFFQKCRKGFADVL